MQRYTKAQLINIIEKQKESYANQNKFYSKKYDEWVVEKQDLLEQIETLKNKISELEK